MKTKFYPLGDHPTSTEIKTVLKINTAYANLANLKAKATGEFSNPRKGKWYLSGGNPHAYRAPNDLSSPYHIAKLVKTQTVITEVEVKE